MIPTLTTARLTLGPFTFEDCERLERLAGNEVIARMTLNIPHPYPAGSSRAWVETHLPTYLKRAGVTFAIRLNGELIGCASLGATKEPGHANLGYWLSVDHWNQGYATEAARACVAFGFEVLSLQKVVAHHFAINPASGRVMEKIGMKKEGFRPQHVRKGEVLHDVVEYGLPRGELT